MPASRAARTAEAAAGVERRVDAVAGALDQNAAVGVFALDPLPHVAGAQRVDAGTAEPIAEYQPGVVLRGGDLALALHARQWPLGVPRQADVALCVDEGR